MKYLVDRERRDEIYRAIHHLPSVIPLPESLKESISGIPEAEKLKLYLLPLYRLDGGNGKAMPAYQLLLDAEKRGRVFPGCTVIVPSSGNTAVNMVYFQTAFGIKEVVAVVDPKTTPAGKIAQLKIPGARVEFTRNNQTTLERAAELAKEIDDAVVINQYEEDGSITGHKPTMNHISVEMFGRGKPLSFMAAATGTCSAFIAGWEYLPDDFPNIHVVGVGCEGDQTPGARTLKAIERDVKFDWPLAAKPYGLVFCERPAAITMSLKIIRQKRTPAGPTCGLALEGLLRRFRFLAEHKELEQFVNGDGEYPAVIVGMDGFTTYGAEYMATLGEAM